MFSSDTLLFERFKLTRRSQSIYRIFFASMVLVGGYYKVPAKIAEFPAEYLHTPPGIAQILPIPSSTGVHFFNFCVMGTCLVLLLGYQTRYCSILLTALAMLGRSWKYSLGKIDHDIMYVVLPAILAFSRWGSMYSVDSLRNQRTPHGESHDDDAWPFALLAILVAFGMMTSGLQKILGGWLDPATPASLGWIVFFGETFDRQALAYEHLQAILNLPPSLIEGMDWAAVGMDLMFPLALLNRRLFQVLCCVAVFFHLGTYLMLGIYFQHQTLVYAAFFSWSRGLAICNQFTNSARSYMPSAGRRFFLIESCVVGGLILVFFLPLNLRQTLFMVLTTLMAALAIIVAARDVMQGKAT